MDKFHVGQRVRLVNVTSSVLRNGMVGTITRPKMTYTNIQGAFSCITGYGAIFDVDGKERCAPERFLEPLRDDDEAFKSFMERLTKLPERVS